MKVLIIAEAGVNHNGSTDMAKKMVDVAVEAGADIFKIQSFNVNKLVSSSSPLAEYQKTDDHQITNQHDLLKNLALNYEAQLLIHDYCVKKGIKFLSSPFDHESLRFLIDINLDLIKIPSGEITNVPLLLEVASSGLSIILSTGMATLEEIHDALAILAFGYLHSNIMPTDLKNCHSVYALEEAKIVLSEKVTLLHCTTQYPTPLEMVNLRAIDTLQREFGLPVGYSDHTLGDLVPVAAVSKGATVIEKHFTLDKNLGGPDHKASMEPEELKLMIEKIRKTEILLGSTEKKPTELEQENSKIVRKSLYASQPIDLGEVITPEKLIALRPGDGISPMRMWEIIGKKSNKRYHQMEKIKI